MGLVPDKKRLMTFLKYFRDFLERQEDTEEIADNNTVSCSTHPLSFLYLCFIIRENLVCMG